MECSCTPETWSFNPIYFVAMAAVAVSASASALAAAERRTAVLCSSESGFCPRGQTWRGNSGTGNRCHLKEAGGEVPLMFQGFFVSSVVSG